MKENFLEYVENLRMDGLPKTDKKEIIDDIIAKLKEQEIAKNNAYQERNALISILSKIFPAYITKHQPEDDPEWDENWKTVVVIDLPTGQVSWHIHFSEIKMFNHLKKKENEWDGHSVEEKYIRMKKASPSALKRFLKKHFEDT